MSGKFGSGNSFAFKKGQSGNPSGRTKQLARVEDLAKTHTALAMQTLAEICGNGDAPASSRVTAAVAILDRGWGKPRQELQVLLDERDMSDEALLAIVAKGQDEMAAEEAEMMEDADSASLH